MAEEWTYHRLCDVYREEKSTNSLTPMASDFHRSLQELISRLTASAAGSLEGQRELEMARKQIRLLTRLRRQKLMMRASMDTAEAEPEGMTASETALFVRLREMYKQEDEQLESLMHPLPAAAMPVSALPASGLEAARAQPNGPGSSSLSEPNGGTSTSPPSKKKIKLLAYVPEYRGEDDVVYGPYASGQSAELPLLEADALLRGKMAEETA
ncbi:Uncharacterised protein [uncultured archaeon]|nr:Uncharacterised protein [uncultured archaeon]